MGFRYLYTHVNGNLLLTRAYTWDFAIYTRVLMGWHCWASLGTLKQLEFCVLPFLDIQKYLPPSGLMPVAFFFDNFRISSEKGVWAHICVSPPPVCGPSWFLVQSNQTKDRSLADNIISLWPFPSDIEGS